MSDIDLVTLEVVRNRLASVAQEMEATLVRSAHSPVVKEALDASAAIFDAKGEMIAQAAALPVHLGSLSPIARHILATFPAATMHPQDIFIMNDPYRGAQHVPDVVIAMPVVFAGEVVALTCSMAHQQDMGGKTPGSTPTDTTEIFQEGLILPALRLFHQGQPNETLFALIQANVRIPDVVVGDMRAQVAAATTGRNRLLALFEEYGKPELLKYVAELQDRAEQMTRHLLSQLKSGSYKFEDYLDNDGVELDRRIKISVEVSIDGSDLTVDFTGTDAQVAGPFNAVPSVALSAARYVTRAITSPDIPDNDGCYRPLTVVTPDGSLVNPRHPAAVASRAVTLRRMVDAMMGALVPALPERIGAASNGHPLNCSLGGIDPSSGDSYVTAIVSTGGMGARPTKDGIDAIQTDSSNAMAIPIEAMELEGPIRVNRYALRADSGGAGKWRGGLGLELFIEIVRGRWHLSHRGERHFTQPWGLFGGRPARSSRTEIHRRNGDIDVVPSKGEYLLEAGDRVHFLTSGGGGYGDPLERDPELLVNDVRDRKVSQAEAHDSYGVVLTDTGTLDVDATQSLRARLSADRGPIRWVYDRGTERL